MTLIFKYILNLDIGYFTQKLNFTHLSSTIVILYIILIFQFSSIAQVQGIEFLNPKSAMFFLAFLPQFVNPENGSVALQLMTLGLLFVLMGLVSTVTVALSAGHIGKFLRRNPVVMRWQNKAVGSIFCGLGVRLALQEK